MGVAEGPVGRTFDLELVQKAARYAEKAHADDVRKGTTIPYIAHLWSVAALVMEYGGDEQQVAAALLHDVVEDHGGEQRLRKVRKHFGDDVADMVAALSDSLVDTEEDGAAKPPWIDRKRAYLDHLATVDGRTALVSAADKLHNLRSIVNDYRALGPALWERFNEPNPAAHRWYYRSLVEVLFDKVPAPMARQLQRSLADLTSLMAVRQPDVTPDWEPPVER